MQKKISTLHVLVILLIILLVLAYIEAETNFFSSSLINSRFNSRKVMVPQGITFEYGSDSKAVFEKGSNGFLCVTKDGANYYTYKGNSVWRQTFSMNVPYIIKGGENYAVLEPTGRKVYVCDSTGVLYTVSPDYPIVSAGLNKMACLILILQVEDTYRIELYNQAGEIPLDRRSELEGVFPVCADLTGDSYMFAVSYLDTTKASVVSRILYSYTDTGAKNLGENAHLPFKAIEREDSVVSEINFLESDNLVVIADNEIFVTSKDGDEIASIKPQNRLTSTAFGNNMFGIVNGEPIPDSDLQTPNGLAEWYSLDGQKIADFPSEQVNTIEIYDNLIMLKNEDNYFCVDKKGRLLWKVGAAQDVLNVIPIDKKRAIVAKTGSAEIYVLKTHNSESQ